MESLPPEGYLVCIQRTAFIPIAAVAGVGVLLSLLFIAVNVRFRGYKLLKMTSPNLNFVMLSGAILSCFAVILFGATAWLPASPSQKMVDIFMQINHAGLWTASIAFSMFFAPLAAKTWRVHRIFSDAAVKGRVIKDDRLLCFVALVVVFDLGYLAVWFGIDAPECQVIPRSQLPGFFSPAVAVDVLNSDDSSRAAESTTVTSLEYSLSCASRYTPLWIVLLCVYKGALLYYIIYVAWATRYVTLPSMKDAGGLIISVFVTLTSFCVATPFVTLLARWPNLQYIALSSAIFIPLYTVMLLHFVPKLVLIRRHSKKDVLTRSFSQYTTPKKPEFSDDEIRDLAIQNASLRKEVTEKQRRYKTVLEQLRVAKAKLFELSVLTSESTDLNTCTSDDVMRSGYTESTGDVSSSKAKGGKQKESLARELANKVTRALILKSQGVLKPDDVSMTSSSPSAQVEDEIKPTESEEATSSAAKQNTDNQPNDGDNKVTQKDPDVSVCDDKKDPSKRARHVSFNSVPMRRVPGEPSDHGLLPSGDKPHGFPGSLVLKPALPVLGRNSWDYYTRGTGYLRYKATVLNQGPNGTVAAITGYPVAEPRPKTFVDKTRLQHLKSGFSQSTPVSQETQGKGVELKTLCENPKQTKSGDFKYFSTSTSSRSPCSSTDPTPSLGRSTDDTTMTNNNIPANFKKSSREKSGTSSNNDTDVPSTNSAFSVVKTKPKRPFTGYSDVRVTSRNRVHRVDDIGITYEDDYSSGSDSDEYGNGNTSLDSITCELFPPLTPRHKHYLRRYDAMQAKYLANRERYQRKLEKTRVAPKAKANPAGNDATKGPTSAPNCDVTNDTPPESEKSGNSSFSQSYLNRESKRKFLAARKIDDAYLYDSITSSDSDSESDWGNSAALQQCWERVAQMGKLPPLLKPGPITFSHTSKDGIFV